MKLVAELIHHSSPAPSHCPVLPLTRSQLGLEQLSASLFLALCNGVGLGGLQGVLLPSYLGAGPAVWLSLSPDGGVDWPPCVDQQVSVGGA